MDMIIKNYQLGRRYVYKHKLIMDGYKIKYCADSKVIHSHNFTLKQLYKRYYDTGKFLKENSYLDKYKSK